MKSAFIWTLLMTFSMLGITKAYSQTGRDSLWVDKIVFDSDRSESRQVFIMNTDGSALKKLTSGPAENMCPSMSPDGTRIVFESRRDGNSEIYIMNSDGTNQKRLTQSAEDEYSQEFSPDGTKIYFNKSFTTRTEIWVMNADGTNPQQLTNNQAHDERPRLSPDGTTILFMSDRDGRYEIYFMDPDGSRQRRLTNSPGNKVFPAWSPDGSRIVYSINTNTGTPVASLYCINSDGTGDTRLTNEAGRTENPGWSPDGKKIVFQSDRTGTFEVYTMNADGSGQQRLTTNSSWDGWPCWGHVRQALNKYLGQTPPTGTLRRFPPASLQMLAGTGGPWTWHGSPIFSPDYQEMFFVKYQHAIDRAEIWYTHLVNNQWSIPVPASFGNLAVTENTPIFSPSGDTLYFYSQRPGSSTIYQCTKQSDGSWANPQPVPLSDEINSLFEDGTLGIGPGGEYVVSISNRPGGYGLHDLYISFLNRDGSWTESVNLGNWINTGQEETFPTISPDGKYLFLNTAREANADQGYNAYWVSTAFIDLMRPVEPDTTNRVVFSSDRDGNPEIYSMYSDGTDVRRLSDNSFMDLHPAWSNDGDQIVFSSDRDGNFELFLMNADGSNTCKLTQTGQQVYCPDWSADGKQIVFMVSDDTEPDEGELATIQTDGTGMQILTAAGPGSRPVWSDDGSTILFTSQRTGSFEIYTMDSDGTNLQQITRSGTNKRFARLSPDGQKIVFCQVSPSGTDTQIHLIDVDGTGDRILTTAGNVNTSPCWSADGRFIFFQTSRYGNSEIYRMDADGRYQVNLSRNSEEDYGPNSIRKAQVSGIPQAFKDPADSQLKNIWPNPAEDHAIIEFSLTQSGYVHVYLIDNIGRPVKNLLAEFRNEGRHLVPVDLQGLASGIYSVVLYTDHDRSVKNLVKN